jgi:dethiobiotin synthase
MHRYFVTGTDTNVGKTRVTAAVALALRKAKKTPTIVKLVQTGLAPGVPGDAARAGVEAGVRYVELARFAKPADPWSAAIAQSAPPVNASELAAELDRIEGPVVAEGVGGILVPINARECIGDVATAAKLDAILVVGLRLGCLNHALLTITQCAQMGLPIAAGILVERWGAVSADYADDVLRTLQGKLDIVGILPSAADERASIEAGSRLFERLVAKE